MDVDLVSSAAVAAALIRAKITPTIVRADFTGASFVIRMINEFTNPVFRAPTKENPVEGHSTGSRRIRQTIGGGPRPPAEILPTRYF